MMRTRRTKADSTDSPTASKARKPRAKSVFRPRVWRTWGSLSRFKNKPSLCLWGDKQTAIEGCEDDEQACFVRIEVLKVIR